MRSTREKKKPKADKSKKKEEAAVSPFASARAPGKPGYANKRLHEDRPVREDLRTFRALVR